MTLFDCPFFLSRKKFGGRKDNYVKGSLQWPWPKNHRNVQCDMRKITLAVCGVWWIYLTSAMVAPLRDCFQIGGVLEDLQSVRTLFMIQMNLFKLIAILEILSECLRIERWYLYSLRIERWYLYNLQGFLYCLLVIVSFDLKLILEAIILVCLDGYFRCWW